MNRIESLVMYIFSFSISSFLFNLSKNRRYNRSLISWIAIIGLLVLGGIREGIGTDYYGYINAYFYRMRTSSIFESFSKEYLFLIIVKLSAILNNYKIMFFLLNFITLIFIKKAIERNYVRDKGLIIYLYLFIFYLESWNLMRQHVCIAVFLFSLYYIYTKQILKYSFFIGIFSFMHMSILVTYPLYFVYNYLINSRKNKKLKEILIGIGIASIVFFIFQYEMIINLLGEIIPIFKRYRVYAKEFLDGSLNLIFIWKLFLLLIVLYNRKKLQKLDGRNRLLIFIVIIDLILTSIGYQHKFLKRISLYFYSCYIFIFPQLLEIYNSKRIILKLLIIIITMLFFILQYYILGHNEVFHYKI